MGNATVPPEAQETRNALDDPRFRGVPRHFHHAGDARRCGRTRTGCRNISTSRRRWRVRRRRLKIIPQEAAAEIVEPLRRQEDRHGEAQGGDRAHRLSGAAGRAAAGQAVQGRARRMVALGRHHAGHHRHRDRHADPRVARPDREGYRRHLRRARRAREEIPRHADGRPQQPAAGGADHLRLQDGDHARRLSSATAAPDAIEGARAGRRIRRRRRHAVVARQGRPESARSS